MNSQTHASVMGNRKNKAVVETVAQIVFTICAFFAVLAVVSITLYMIISGTPAILKVGLKEILFSTEWMPTAAEPKFGILWVILTSIVGTTLAILLGVPIGVLTAVFLAEVAPRPLAAIVKPAVELLAGIPSVIYGLLGIYLLNPLMYQLERLIFRGSTTHQFTACSDGTTYHYRDGGDRCADRTGDHDPAHGDQYQRDFHTRRSRRNKIVLPGTGCFPCADHFPVHPSGSQIRNCDRYRSGSGTSYRRGYGYHTGIRQQRECAPAL